MTKALTRNLRQRAVVWTTKGVDKFNEATISKPVEIKCRWEDGITDSMNVDGNVVNFDGMVFVDRQLSVGDLIWKGKITAKPLDANLTNLREIVQISSIPNLKNTRTEYIVYVNNYHQSLPEYG